MALQRCAMTERFPGFKYQGDQSAGAWEGTLQPRDVSPAYRVRIGYRLGDVPQVKIVWPDIVPGVHHLWQDGTLCLYYPKEWIWNSNCIMALTIVPWTALWLLYYELWLDTGKWLGSSVRDSEAKSVNEVTR